MGCCVAPRELKQETIESVAVRRRVSTSGSVRPRCSRMGGAPPVSPLSPLPGDGVAVAGVVGSRLEGTAPGCGGAPLAEASCGAGRKTPARSTSSGSEGRALPRMVRLDWTCGTLLYGLLLGGDGYRGSVGGRQPRHLRLRAGSRLERHAPHQALRKAVLRRVSWSVSHWNTRKVATRHRLQSTRRATLLRACRPSIK